LAGKILPREENERGHKWANYGGDKDWLAPQGFDTSDQWAGPPDYTIDGSRYAAKVIKDTPDEVALQLTSPPDERSGLIISRVYHVERGSTRVRLEHTMQNISVHTVRSPTLTFGCIAQLTTGAISPKATFRSLEK
jgi:hypothetical protein